MNEADKQAQVEQQKYVAGKTFVDVYKMDESAKKKFFSGLVTSVTSRGVVVNPVGEEGGDSLDVLAGSFIPYNVYCPKFLIQISRRND